MTTFKSLVTVRATILVALGLMSCSVRAQDGVPFQLREAQQQLVRIEVGVNILEQTVNEVVLLDRSRCDRPVSWNRKLPAGERFVPALNGHAFCDLETGLV
jgi:hypothetical protein